MLANLKASTFTAILWSIVRVGWTNLAAFVIFLVLARILGPKEFGLYALAAAVLDIIRVLVNAGISDAIQRERDLTEEASDTAFFAGLAISLLLMAVMIVIANPYAHLMRTPELAPVLMTLSLALPVIALGNVHVARTLRAFGHKYIAVRSVIAGLFAGLAAIGAAWNGAGVWALVIQVLLVEIVGTVVAWIAFPWRPQLRFNIHALRNILAFGGSMMITQLLWAALSRVPEFFIGRTLSLNDVGVYRVAWRVFDLIGQSILQPIGSVALITLARLQDDLRTFRNAYARIVGVGSLVSLPLIFGFGLVAQELVPLIFGERWEVSGKIAAIVSISGVPFTLNYFFAPALAAKGRAKTLAGIAAVQLTSTLFLAWLFVRYGIAILAGAMVFRAYLTLPYIQYQLHRFAGIKVVDVLWPVSAPLICCASMVVAVLFMQHYWISSLDSRTLRVALGILIGTIAYVASFLVLAPELLRSHFEALRPLLWKRDPK